MKTLIRAALFTLPLLAAGSQAALAEVQKRVKNTNSGYLNVRSGPGTNYADIGDLPSGTLVSVLGYDPSGRWAIINWQGQVAYVARSFLVDPAQPQPQTANDGTGMHRVNGIPANDPDGGLVVRIGPGTGFGRLLVLPEGTAINVVEVSPNRKWSRVELSDGGYGWVRNRYLRSAAPQPQPQPQPGATYVVTTPGYPVQVFEFPNDTAPQITILAPNTPIAVLEPLSGDWLKVSVQGQVGYMHETGTAMGGGSTSPQGMQAGLTCAGTEPFWTFQINSNGTTSFEDVGSQGAPITGAITSVGGTSYPYSFQSGAISGQLNNQQCSDGMSDIIYPFELFLTVTTNASSQNLQGCCLLQ